MVDIKIFTAFDDKILADIFTLEEAIFDKALGADYILADSKNRHNLYGLIVYDDGKPVAYKVGYEASPKVFYSWLGGVLPNHRGQGIAKRLMQQQHEFARECGYKRVRTHTFNKFKTMIILNIKTGFDIVGLTHSAHEDGQKIILERFFDKDA